MKKLLMLLFFVLPLAACGESETTLTLTETLGNMLVLIDQKKDKELLTKYADMSKHGADQVGIPAHKLSELKAALMAAQKIKPVLSDDGNTALFEAPQFKRPMKFVMIDGAWRFAERALRRLYSGPLDFSGEFAGPPAIVANPSD